MPSISRPYKEGDSVIFGDGSDDPLFAPKTVADQTAVDSSTVDGTYGAQEEAVIQSLVIAVGELQALLATLGFANDAA